MWPEVRSSDNYFTHRDDNVKFCAGFIETIFARETLGDLIKKGRTIKAVTPQVLPKASSFRASEAECAGQICGRADRDFCGTPDY
jgi:hypothetical protein